MNLTSVQGWADACLGLVFPERDKCLLCKMPVRGSARGLTKPGLCTLCLHKITRCNEPMCAVCGRLHEGPLCAECRDHPHVFFRARAFARYDATIVAAIKALKYQGDRRLLSILGGFLVQAYGWHYGSDRHVTLVPVPMHPEKVKRRGFNQAEELALYLGHRLRVSVITDALLRTEDRESQTTHTRLQRIASMRGTYVLDQKGAKAIAGKYVVLIDDVLTTGATADACASLLFKASAASVEVLTVAR